MSHFHSDSVAKSESIWSAARIIISLIWFNASVYICCIFVSSWAFRSLLVLSSSKLRCSASSFPPHAKNVVIKSSMSWSCPCDEVLPLSPISLVNTSSTHASHLPFNISYPAAPSWILPPSASWSHFFFQSPTCATTLLRKFSLCISKTYWTASRASSILAASRSHSSCRICYCRLSQAPPTSSYILLVSSSIF